MVSYTNYRSVVQPQLFNVSRFSGKSKIWKTTSLLPWFKAIQKWFLTAQIWAAYRAVINLTFGKKAGMDLGGGCRGCTPPPP